MATTTNITTSYAGEFALPYVSQSLLTANTLSSGLITIKPNIKFRETMKRLDTNDILKDGTCDFDSTSTITLTERVLEPKELQVNLTLCKKDFRSDWEAMSMGVGAFDNLPKNFSDYLLGYSADKVAAKNETNIWRGVSSNTGEYDGFETLLALDANLPAAQEVLGTTVNSSNVIVELGKIVDAIPSNVYGNEGLKIFVSRNIMKAYIRALGGFGASGLGANGTNAQGTQWYDNGALSFDGLPIVMCSGMSDNVAIATTSDNLAFGTGLLSDQNEAKVIDMADIDGSQNVRIVMRMTGGVQYAVVEDIVTYGITNSAN